MLEDRPRIEHQGKDTSEVIMNNRKGAHTPFQGRILEIMCQENTTFEMMRQIEAEN